MAGVRLNGSADIFGDLFTCGSFTEKLDVFFPGKRHQNAHPRGSATIEEPARRRMINPHNVHTRLAHQRQIGIQLFWPADIISIRIRFERTVRDPFDEKLLVSVEEKLRSGSDSGVCCLCHVSVIRDISRRLLCFRRKDSFSLRTKLRPGKRLRRSVVLLRGVSHNSAKRSRMSLVRRAVLCTSIWCNSERRAGGAPYLPTALPMLHARQRPCARCLPLCALWR